MSDSNRGGRGGSRGRGRDRGGGQYRGGGGGDRGGGQYRGGGGGDRGGGQYRGGGGGDRGGGQYRGQGGGRGGGNSQVAFRPAPGAGTAIYTDGQAIPAPDPSVIAAEDALVKNTKGRTDIPGFEGFTGRSGYGTSGTKIVLRTNYFALTTVSQDGKPGPGLTLYRYAVEIKKPEPSKPKRRRLLEAVMRRDMFKDVQWATDYAATIVTTNKLDKDQYELTETVPTENDAQTSAQQDRPPDFVTAARARSTFTLRITFTHAFDTSEMVKYLQSSLAGAIYNGREDLIQLLNSILAHGPSGNQNIRNVGRTFYPFGQHPGLEQYDLGGGLRALRGYFASVRPAVNRLLVNMNVCSGAFFKPMPLLDLMREAGGSNQQIETFVRMLKVEARYVKDKQSQPFMTKTKTIVGFAKELNPPTFRVRRFGNAKEVKFGYTDTKSPNAQPKQITVFDYFQQHHGITLRRPEEPVLNVGTPKDPQYLPAELCIVLDGQAYRRLLSGGQTKSMLDFAARVPNLNALSIAGTVNNPGNGLKLWRLAGPPGQPDPQIQGVQKFGFRVGTSMLTVPGRILSAPKVRYQGNEDAPTKLGSWNLKNVKFITPGTINHWQAVVINRAGNGGFALDDNPNSGKLAREDLINKLEGSLKLYGMKMGKRQPTQIVSLEQLTLPNRPSNDRKIKSAFENAKGRGVQMLFVIIPEADKWLYARLKVYGDIEYGISTICSVGQKLQKPGGGQAVYMANLALKFNLKSGGVSHTVSGVLDGPVDINTMLMGIDVTHPSPDSVKGAPSIACVVASIDQHMFQWPGSIRRQDGRKEMVTDLKEMVCERLDLWHKKNKRYPSKIIIYRDGVSEGQYDQVLDLEMKPFNKALEAKYGKESNWPKTAVIIVGKRHHTRFYPTQPSDADGEHGLNPRPGTVVDRVIVNKVLREFYLQAHQSLKGTARPAHYVVIKDDIGFSADDLEQFTHKLCYMYTRATKAVSICPPAYYADRLCERGRAYLFSVMAESQGSDSASFNGDQEWKGGVHPRLAETTWYI